MLLCHTHNLAFAVESAVLYKNTHDDDEEEGDDDDDNNDKVGG